MSFFKRLYSSIVASQELRARRLVRSELMSFSDYRLQDLGFDRMALNKGVEAWPWRSGEQVDVAAEAESQPLLSRRQLRQAERELAAMSDRELFELGIARTDIRRAVNGDIERAA